MEENRNHEDILNFVSPKERASYIKVFGVGGGGSNAVNHMYRQGIKGVDFVVCNTDAQSLEASPVATKIQIGRGLGAGNVPSVACQAAEEKKEEIKRILNENTQMLFITAGMGGGTGTGAAPVIASIAKEIELEDEVKKILTVAIVTTPFSFEGKKRKLQAQEGIAEMRKYVDAILIINNDKLREFGKMSMKDAFAMADDVLTTAARGISEIITVSSYIQIDFKDVNTVMSNSGVALMGCGTGSGENRAKEAALMAMDSPLLNDNSIEGAKNMLLYISYGDKAPLLMDEIESITSLILSRSGSSLDLIWGAGEDSSLDESLSLTLVATGFNEKSYTEPTKVSIAAIETNGTETKNEIVQTQVLTLEEVPQALVERKNVFGKEIIQLEDIEVVVAEQKANDVHGSETTTFMSIHTEQIETEIKEEKKASSIDVKNIADAWFEDMQKNDFVFASIEEQAEEQAQVQIEAQAKAQAEAAAAEEALIIAQIEAEARAQAEAEAARIKAQIEAEARAQAEAEAARIKAQIEAEARAQAEAETARLKAQIEAEAKAEAEAEAKAEVEAKAQAEAEAMSKKSWIASNITSDLRGEHAGFSLSEIEEVSMGIELMEESEHLVAASLQRKQNGYDTEGKEEKYTVAATAPIPQTPVSQHPAYQERMNRMRKFKEQLGTTGGLKYMEDIPALKRKEIELAPELLSSESEVGELMISPDGRITKNAYLRENEKVD